MSRYTVTWLRRAQNHLAQIWVDAPDREAVSSAAHAIDTRLANDPSSKGTAVAEGLRSLHVPPLYVLFEVRESDRLVEVASVRTDQPLPPRTHVNGESHPPG